MRVFHPAANSKTFFLELQRDGKLERQLVYSSLAFFSSLTSFAILPFTPLTLLVSQVRAESHSPFTYITVSHTDFRPLFRIVFLLSKLPMFAAE